MSAPATSLPASPAGRDAPPLAGRRERTGAALLGLVLLAAALRFSTLGVQSLWLDEAVTGQLLDGSLGDVVSRVPRSESTPHLYYVLAWAWTQVFGAGDVGLRSFSALLGTAFVPVAYAAAKALAGSRAGLAAAALAATNPMLLYYSQEARAYMLVMLLSGLAFVAFLRASGGAEPRRASWIAAWAVASALALTAHYFAVFPLLAEAAWLLKGTRGPDRRRVAWGLGLVTAVGLALVPLALEQRSHGYADWIGEDPLPRRVAEVAKQFVVGLDGPLERPTGALALLIAAVVLVLFARRADRRERAAALRAGSVGVAALVLPLAVALVGSDFFNGRNVLPAWLPLAAVLAMAIASRHVGRAGPLALGALCALGLAVFAGVLADSRYQRTDWRAVARTIGPAAGARLIEVQDAQDAIPLGRYLPRLGPAPPGAVDVREIDVVAFGEASPGRVAEPPVPATLAAPPGFRLAERRTLGAAVLLRYRAPRPVATAATAAAAPRFGGPTAVLLQDPPS